MTIGLHAATVRKGFATGSAPVLRGVDISLKSGSLTIVRGASGAGKSTLLRCLAGTYRLDGGHVWLRSGTEEHPVSAADARTVVWLRSHHLGLADGHLVCAPREPAVAAVVRTLERAGDDPAAALEEAGAVLTALGSEAVADTPVGLLSRRASRTLAIVRGLLRPPGILLLDEPTLGLETEAFGYVNGLIEAARDAGTAVLVTAREPTALAAKADALLHLRAGRLR